MSVKKFGSRCYRVHSALDFPIACTNIFGYEIPWALPIPSPSLSVFLSSSFVNCEIQNLRTSYLGTWPPSFYETFDKRLRAKFPGSFVTRLLQHSDFRPLFLACLRFSYATLPQSSSNLHCSSGWIRFDVLLLRRNVYVIDCMIETKFISGLY